MSQRGWLFISVVLLISMAFAGCLGDEEKPDTGTGLDDDGDDGTGGSDTNETGGDTDGDTDTAPGEAPTAVFDVLPASDLVVGANVTFNASASEDPEGGNLTFSWDFGDEETGEGVEVIHVYDTAANYTVVLTVTDAEGLTATVNQTIIVGEASTGYTDSTTGTVTAPHPVFAALPYDTPKSTYETAGVEGTNYFRVEFKDIPTSGAELSFKASSTSVGVGLLVFDPDGKKLGQGQIGAAGTSEVKLTEAAAIAHGTYTVFVFSAAAPNMDFTLTATLA